ncbi:hypothetical protein MPLB_740027 [Mesorhizobium sp. ORS 3324]|nr:hypothetical protein MPLB_740027 [Mesorhizobium sp. ORS 3324]
MHQKRLRIAQPQEIDIFVERHAGRFLEQAHGVFRMDVGGRRDVHTVDVVEEILGDEIAHAPDIARGLLVEGAACSLPCRRFRHQPVRLEAHPLEPQQQLVDGMLGLCRVARARIVVPAFEIVVVGLVGGIRHQGRAGHQPVPDIGRQVQPEEMHQRQMCTGIDRVVRQVVHLVRQPAPEQAHLTGRKRDFMLGHTVMHAALHDEVHLHLGVPMRLQHHQRVVVEHLQRQRQAFDAARARLVERTLRHLTFRQFLFPFDGDKPSAPHNLAMLTLREQMKWEDFNAHHTDLRGARACHRLRPRHGAIRRNHDLELEHRRFVAEGYRRGLQQEVPRHQGHGSGPRQPADL